MLILILFVLGLAFGYAAGWPWGLLAFIVPVLLTLGASERSIPAVILGFVLTAAGVLAGVALARRNATADA
jgi:uncharacterized membrane protein